jgi:Xaa-Pro aminopeptidase
VLLYNVLICCILSALCCIIGIDAGLLAAKRGSLLSDVYLHAYNALIRSGSEEPAYLPIVRSSDPAGHGQWEVNERYGIRQEDGRSSGLVFIELSGCRFGHHSPRMQTAYFVSCNPDNSNQLPAWLVEAGELIVRVFDACLPLMRPGVLPSHIDSVGRGILNSYSNVNATSAGRMGYTVGGTATNPTGNAGWGDACFSIAGNNHTPLQENQVFHFIPWLQINDGQETGPIGLSDTVIVTPEGGRRVGKHVLRIIPLADDGTDLSAVSHL